MLFIGPDSCTDWGGAVALFAAIDPDVREVYTVPVDYPESNEGTAYVRAPDDWTARRIAPQRCREIEAGLRDRPRTGPQ